MPNGKSLRGCLCFGGSTCEWEKFLWGALSFDVKWLQSAPAMMPVGGLLERVGAEIRFPEIGYLMFN